VSLQLEDNGTPHILYIYEDEILYARGVDPTTTTPIPDPMTWDVLPQALNESEILMTASTAIDPNGVEYYFEETTGNPGGSDSGWQDSPVYTDTGLSSNTEYCYRVRARDKSSNQNSTEWSAAGCATTHVEPEMKPPEPDPMTWDVLPQALNETEIVMTASTATDLDGVEYYFEETTGNPGGSDSGWQDNPVYTDSGLSSGTEYCYRVRARDKSPNQNATGWSAFSWTPTGPANSNDPPAIDWIDFLPFDNPENYLSPWPRLEDLVLDAAGNAYGIGGVDWNDPSLGWPGITFVGKWSPSGELLWEEIYDSPDERQHARAAAMDSEGNLFVVGIRATSGAPSWFIFRIDESGMLQEAWAANDGLYKCFRSVDIHPNGDLIVCANYGSSDSWVGRFDWKTSTWVWGHVYDIDPATHHDFDIGAAGALDPEGDIYYFGRNITIGGSQEIVIAKISAVDGMILDLEYFDFGPGYEEFPTAFSVDSKGNLIGLAWHVEDNRGTVFKLDSELNPVWTHAIQGNQPYVFLRELDIGPDDTIYVVGRDGEDTGWYENSQNSHIFTCALSSDGELLWMHRYDAGGPDDKEWGSGNGIACSAVCRSRRPIGYVLMPF
jgi:hypothetical protein